jgi:hypothetical protein
MSVILSTGRRYLYWNYNHSDRRLAQLRMSSKFRPSGLLMLATFHFARDTSKLYCNATPTCASGGGVSSCQSL